ncbi:DUF4190 domain-containing protein [Pelagicoccus sp. NFK12]|uniref:DUF4190 domain-containing protein n=1 Tax=Pelagicoccus enzymogenes TaxID=2773457 RepID=A0A927FDH5_9BACT|nr:DUF4190 domain-containing protein [Pelagicoccus enzymogenes]MBD5782381.1 DUF4190 domain-containing protein [Pelagicoccus enzymogenes]MDQ8200987.1 DUF4190 domain-containing protein [Pelagicoccus enzymogenes]
MNCVNHPETPSDARCTGCQEPFCQDCLVEINGEKYCGSCKVMAVDSQAPVNLDQEETIPNKQAGEALIMAIIGIFCFGFILGPIAIYKASKAKKEMDEDPRQSGRGKATAAQVIGCIIILLNVISILSVVAGV